MQIIDYLTAILVIVTAIYAYLTYKMAKSSEASVLAIREQSEAMSRPYVVISPFVRPHTSLLYLKVENTGRTMAADLQLKIDRDFFQFGEPKQPNRNLRTMTAFTTSIKSLPPNAKLVFALGQGFVIFAQEADDNITPKRFCITATYTFGFKTVTEENHIDLTPYVGSEGERDPVVDELEKIRKSIEKMQ